MPSPTIFLPCKSSNGVIIRISIFLRFARGASSATAPSKRVGDRAVSESQVTHDIRESVTPGLIHIPSYIELNGNILLEAGRVSPLCRSRDSDRWSHVFLGGELPTTEFRCRPSPQLVKYLGVWREKKQKNNNNKSAG